MWEKGRKPHVSTRMRQAVLHRDGHQCQHCGTLEGPFDIDHIDNHRGPHYGRMENLQVLCVSCHKAKIQLEATAARNARFLRGRYPVQQHPGLV